MTDQEWQAYMAQLPPDLADLAAHIMERINTVLNRERSRALGDTQTLHQRLDNKKTKIADLRVIVADLAERIAALEAQAGDE